MKKIIISAVLTATLLLFAPLASLSADISTPIETSVTAISSKKTEFENPQTFKLLFSETGKIEVLNADDYIFGVLAAEMPALYEEEALKAQAVAAYTFALRKKVHNKKGEYDISDDHTTDQSFITEEKAREKWGENADEYIKKIKEVIESTNGLYLEYDGEPALCVYHAVSFGMTEDAKNVWGNEIPYLVSVENQSDLLAPNYLQNFSFTEDEFKEKMSTVCEINGDISTWLGESMLNETGSVKTITVCGKEITGEDVRKALLLPSKCFKIEYKDSLFCVETKGYGHGVGMSQFGANSMAKQGSNFKEILNKYYAGCQLKSSY